MKFKEGESGNPDGRPKGIKDKRVVLRELLEPHAEGLVQKTVELALSGDTTALRLCLERLIPPIKAREIEISIVDGLSGTLTEQGQIIIEAMGNGVLTPSDASTMLQALAAQARVIELDELEQRVKRLEARRVS